MCQRKPCHRNNVHWRYIFDCDKDHSPMLPKITKWKSNGNGWWSHTESFKSVVMNSCCNILLMNKISFLKNRYLDLLFPNFYDLYHLFIIIPPLQEALQFVFPPLSAPRRYVLSQSSNCSSSQMYHSSYCAWREHI